MDGKTLRDARRDGRQVHLLAVMDHATRAVVAQRQVDGAPGEVPGFRPLLADRELADTVVTADALQTHRDAAEFFVVAKRRTTCWPSRPTSPPSCRAAPSLPGIVFLSWTARATRPTAGSSSAPSRPSRCITSGSRTPRRSSRSPQASWPTHPAVANRDGVRDHQPQLRQASPARLADLLRGQWAIENGLHWVRDVTFAEDGSQVRTGAAPQVMACLRNLVIGALSRAGPVNVAAALRRHARDPRRPLATLGIRLG
ncbi:MAG TPA: transposase [Actinomycetes bacterium]|nr:transposase [Actinomycetes bacterium]